MKTAVTNESSGAGLTGAKMWLSTGATLDLVVYWLSYLSLKGNKDRHKKEKIDK